MPNCLYEQPEAWTAKTELASGEDRAFLSPGLSLPVSTSRPPTECEEDCQEEGVEEDERLCEVFIHDEEGNARAELRFLDRFPRQICLTIVDKVVGQC